jgi:hypothetical protein
VSSFSLLAPVLILQTGCLVAGALPPSRTDIGTTVIAGDGEMESGIRFSTGAHLASGTTRVDFPVDIGAGYVYERLARPPASAVRDGAASHVSSAPMTDLDDARDLHGGYLDAAYTFSRGAGHRSWIGARGELLFRAAPDVDTRVAGVYARAAWELYKPGEGGFGGFTSRGVGGGVGVSHGTAGLGLFLEAGARRGEGDESAFVATAGLSVRLPFLAGLFFDLCPKC